MHCSKKQRLKELGKLIELNQLASQHQLVVPRRTHFRTLKPQSYIQPACFLHDLGPFVFTSLLKSITLGVFISATLGHRLDNQPIHPTAIPVATFRIFESLVESSYLGEALWNRAYNFPVVFNFASENFINCIILISNSHRIQATMYQAPEARRGLLPPLYVQIFGNSVILRIIEGFMEYTDLKWLREVNRTLNNAVLEESNFISRTSLHLNKETLQCPAFNNLSFLPKHISISPYKTSPESGTSDYDNAITKNVCKLAESCLSLHLYEGEMEDEHSEHHDDEIFGSNYCPKILDVVLFGKILQELIMHEGATHFLKDTTESQSQSLPNLKIIAFTGCGVHRSFPPILTSCQGLTYIDTPALYPKNPEFTKKIIDLAMRNRETIADFSIFVHHGLNILGQGIDFPNLESIKLRTPLPPVTPEFLTANFKLKKLQLLLDRTSDGPFLETVFLSILKLPNLKVLAVNFSGLHFPSLYPVLSQLKALPLQKLTLYRLPEYYIRKGHNVIDCIPASIKKLSLGLVTGSPADCPQSLGSLINLSSLTTLDFQKLNELTNSFLREMLPRLIHLHRLSIVSCPHISDDAFVQENEEADADDIPLLINLKGLKSLVLCQNISRHTLRQIKFQKLMNLNLGGVKVAAEDKYFKMLVINNPSLERFYGDIEFKKVQDLLSSMGTRTRLKYFDKDPLYATV